MKINARITLVILFFTVVLAATIITASHFIISSDYNSLEETRARSEMGQAVLLIRSDLANRERVVTDWAVWNDTYRYLDNPEENRDYVLDNIDETIFLNLDLDYLVFYGNDGRVVYSTRFNRATGLVEPLSEQSLAYLNSAKDQLDPDDPEPLSGILAAAPAPIIVAMQRVRPTVESGTSNGVLLMARDVDETELARFRELTSSSLAVMTLDSPDLSPEVLTRFGQGTDVQDGILVTVNENSGIESYAALPDLQGRTGVIVRIQEPKEYLILAQETFFKIFILTIVLTAFFGLIIYFIVRELLVRLEKLNAFVMDIGGQGNLSKRITLPGNDEISAIGTQMNRMLESLEKSQADLAEAHRAVMEVNKKLNLMTSITRHDIVNRLNSIIGYLGLIKDPGDKSESELWIAKVEESAAAIQKSITFTTTYQKLGTNPPVWYDLEDLLLFTVVPPHITFQATLPTIQIYADALVEQVFGNLLDNTLRHGGNVSEIRVTSALDGDNLVIAWEDDGVGIPASEKEKIFKRGYGRNTGMGLFLIREILSLTGITIRENGEPGKGARFEIIIPKGRYRIL